MEWTQFIIMFIGIFGLFIWNRAEGRSDVRHAETQLNSIRELVHSIHQESVNFQKSMFQESKDFHSRLCEIEKNRRN